MSKNVLTSLCQLANGMKAIDWSDFCSAMKWHRVESMIAASIIWSNILKPIRFDACFCKK